METHNNSTIGLTQALILSSLLVAPTTGELEEYTGVYPPLLIPKGFQGTTGTKYPDISQYEYVDHTSSGYSKIHKVADEFTLEGKRGLLLEVLEDFTTFQLDSSLEQDLVLTDDNVNEKSFFHALSFLWNNISDKITMPVYDIHPDGEFSFVWRNSQIGILSLSFEESGSINYASYFEKSNETHKGRATLNNDRIKPSSQSIIFSLIEEFS